MELMAKGTIGFATSFVLLVIGCAIEQSEDQNSTARSGDPPPSLVIARRPAAKETGGENTNFYFRYATVPGQSGACQTLIISDNQHIPQFTTPWEVAEVQFERVSSWKELYSVSPPVVEKLERCLVENGFFHWKSIAPGNAGSHPWLFEIIAKTSSGTHRVQIYESTPEIHAAFHASAGSEIEPSDSEELVLAKRFFHLLHAVRAIAKQDGEPIK